MSVAIRYVDGPRLARSLQAAADWVAAGREEINRINVFPVPDGDTGTNFSLTLRAVADALQALGDASLGETAATAARGAVLGARGNSGMMLAHFLLGFADQMRGKDQATAAEVAQGFRRGAEQLYASLDDPREGTILTVAREAAVAAERAASDSPDISAFMTRLLQEGEVSLARTPELMQALKDAGVVDAGGKGFVRMLEGVVRYIEGDPILPAAPFAETEAELAPAAHVEVAAERDFQYCTEVMIRGDQLPAANPVRKSALEYINAYEGANGKGSVSTFGGHAWDAGQILKAAIPVALKGGQPGTPQFRNALRDALEGVKEVPGAHGIFNMSASDHLGLDQRARVMVKIENGRWKYQEVK